MAHPFFFSHKKKRAVSELLAVIMLLGITIIGFGIYYSYATSNFRQSRTALVEQLDVGIWRAGQQLGLIYNTPIPSQSSPSVSLYIYNYGSMPYNVTDLLVNNVPIPAMSLSFRDPVTGNSLSNSILASTKLTRVDFTYSGVTTPVTIILRSNVCLGGNCFFGRFYTWQLG